MLSLQRLPEPGPPHDACPAEVLVGLKFGAA
jgi:hypothetical protein